MKINGIEVRGIKKASHDTYNHRCNSDNSFFPGYELLLYNVEENEIIVDHISNIWDIVTTPNGYVELGTTTSHVPMKDLKIIIQNWLDGYMSRLYEGSIIRSMRHDPENPLLQGVCI